MTTLDLLPVDAVLSGAVPTICPAAQLTVHWRGVRVLCRAHGWLDPDTQCRPSSSATRFDLASLTKLFTVTTFMTLVEEGRVGLDQPLGNVLDEFNDERPVQPYEHPLEPGAFITVADGGTHVHTHAVTFRHLLTHTSGLPAWRPLWRQADADAARRMALTTFFACQPGVHVIYSDIGLILLGMAIERLRGQPLGHAISARVLKPLRLAHTAFVPLADREPNATMSDEFAPTEFCAWRGRRMAGQVHDENAYRLGGIAGHAGLFATSADVAQLGQMFLDGGAPILAWPTVAEMRREQASEGDLRRGLGFVLWTSDGDEHGFSAETFGHTGFTGTSLWVDPQRELVVALLTNEVYHGRADRKIMQLRQTVHRAVVAAVDVVAAAEDRP